MDGLQTWVINLDKDTQRLQRITQQLAPTGLAWTRISAVYGRDLPEPERQFSNFVPSAAPPDTAGQVVSVYGNAVTYAGQNQVVTINRGTQHGMLPGHVLAVLRNSARVTDTTDRERVQIQLPGERNGLMIVFRTFERVSYALVMQAERPVKATDIVATP